MDDCAYEMVLECEVKHEEPFDFWWCEVHDRTFEVGGDCDHRGLSEIEWMEEREHEQRIRAIVAEEKIEDALDITDHYLWYSNHTRAFEAEGADRFMKLLREDVRRALKG